MNYQFDNAPIIKIDFDKKINNKTNKEYLKDVSATYNNEDISSYIRVNVIKEDDDKVLVSYSVDDNDKSCFLLREINIEKSDTSENADKWVWPTTKPYRISRGLSKTHNGLDIFGPKRGSSIFAAFDGEVVDINSNSSSGYYVTIKHENGYYTRYAHLQNTDGNDKLNLTNSATKYIKVGQKVHAKEIIGEMGASGNSTGIHLHFEVWGGEPFKSKLYNPQIFY